MGEIRTQQLYPAKEWSSNIRVSAASVSGTRSYQEDCLMYQVLEDGMLGVVCDGMGGMSHGERASACAVDGLFEYFKEHPRRMEQMGAYWNEAIKNLDNQVTGLRGRDGKPLNGGTTMVAVFLQENLLSYGSVGDSMIYLIRDGNCKSMVRMHNYRMILEGHLKEGRMTEEEFQSQMKRGEALISYLGMGGLEVLDCAEQPFVLKDGDCIVLCSDGLYKVLSQTQIQKIVEECKGINFERTALELLRAILTGPPQKLDNISILCFWYNEKPM